MSTIQSLDLKESLRKKADDLENKAKILREITISWEPSIHIKCSELVSKIDIEKNKYYEDLKIFTSVLML